MNVLPLSTQLLRLIHMKAYKSKIVRFILSKTIYLLHDLYGLCSFVFFHVYVLFLHLKQTVLIEFFHGSFVKLINFEIKAPSIFKPILNIHWIRESLQAQILPPKKKTLLIDFSSVNLILFSWCNRLASSVCYAHIRCARLIFDG